MLCAPSTTFSVRRNEPRSSADIVETPLDVQFRELLGSPELSNELRDKRQWVFVLHSHGIEHAVVLHQTECAVLLLNKEDGQRHRRLGRSDSSGVEVLLKERV